MKKKISIIALILIVLIIVLFLINKNNTNTKKDSAEKINTEVFSKEQWALNNSSQVIKGVEGNKGYDVNASGAWGLTKGDPAVIVGILDTGIEVSNPFISKNIFVNKKEIEGNGIDDDGNGFIDDVNGWDFYDNDNSVYDDYLSDYHGTFITSLIVGAHEKNNKVWGIAPNVKILPLKFMRGSSGNVDDAVKAIDYAYKLGVRIINCSWDNTIFDRDLYEIMKKYDDVLFISSSGNTKNDIRQLPTYPCDFDLDNVVCVSAVDNKGDVYEFSGYGKSDLIAAPGKDILGMLPEGDYLYADGTSFATAYVTGIAALAKSKFMESSSVDIAKALKNGQNSIENIIDAEVVIENMMNLR